MQRGGGQTIDEGLDIDVDGSNNTYTTGYFTSIAKMDTFTISSAGLEDVFIAKTDSLGFVMWLKSVGGSNSDKGLAIDVDSAGNFVITGFYLGTSVFDGQQITSVGQRDLFIAKYNSAGTLLWVKSAGGAGNETGNSVTFDNAGNVIVTGEFSGTCSFGAVSLTSLNNSIDVFTVKYDSNGNELWAKKGSAKFTDRGTDVSVDANNNIYVTGMFSDTITFDNKYDNAIYNAMFLIKYSSSGAEQWVRWLGSGSSVNMGGISIHNSDVNITGNFVGTLYFLGTPNITTLFGNDPNSIFVCRYDVNGNLIWSHADGSKNEVSAEAITTNANGEINITGNFKCRFTDFSNVYGDGIFCSIGYWDTYISAYDDFGNWIWARQSGGKLNDFANGITTLSNNKIVSTGSFQDAFSSTVDTLKIKFHGLAYLDYRTYNSTNFLYCADSTYGDFIQLPSRGNSDIYINANTDLYRQPFDYFIRTGTSCIRNFIDICITDNPLNSICPDTLIGCFSSALKINFNMLSNVSPDFNYLWSNGNLLASNTVSASGIYSVTVTSTDGCFVNQDSIYVVSNTSSATPEISDSKGVNTNSAITNTISFCIPDSVTLTCTNVGTNTVQWANFPVGQNPITVTNSGYYAVGVTNQNGCVNYNDVHVETFTTFQPLQIKLHCLEDIDFNDTITICNHTSFSMLLYDQLTNPNAVDSVCLDGTFHWLTSNQFMYNNAAVCINGHSINYFTAIDSGTYTITIDAWLIRENICDTDSVFCTTTLTVIVNPSPPGGTFSIAISGSTEICIGDSVMLIVSPPQYVYSWSTGQTNDTIFVNNPGYYGVTTTKIITNSFGCKTAISGVAGILISNYSQPVISLVPATGLICPNDSIQLVCSGTGSCSWQGPNGALLSNATSVYVNNSGLYYCVQTVGPGCPLVSNTQRVYQYNTPFLYAIPISTICKNQSVELSLITNLGSSAQWQSPLSGSNLSQMVFTAGIYNCTVSSCNIVTPLSITVYSDSAEAIISTDNNVVKFCEGDTLALHANNGMNKYLWLPSGDSTLSSFATQSGDYSLFTTSLFGCKDSAFISLLADANNLIAPFIADSSLCPGDSILYRVVNPNPIHWSLTPNYSNAFYIGNTYQTSGILNPITYYIYLDSGVCKSQIDHVNVLVKSDCNDLFIPTIFSPNNDGVNDFFPGLLNYKELKIEIFNRWGKLIYNLANKNNGWNGTNNNGDPAPVGSYYYVIRIAFYDETIINEKGFITLIR